MVRTPGGDYRIRDCELTDEAQVNLYTLCDYCIKPATKARQCSLVELMASCEQEPDYFVSQ